jgi:hypothetical protein
VAGVQELSRQHSSFVPFFQTLPSTFFQLSIVPGAGAVLVVPDVAQPPRAATAKSIATVFNFFMILLSEKQQSRCVRPNQSRSKPKEHGFRANQT